SFRRARAASALDRRLCLAVLTRTGQQPQLVDRDQRSIERDCDLLDVDAFLDHPQVVIRDSYDDDGAGIPESYPDEPTDECHIAACGGSQFLDQKAAKARDAEQERQPKNLPAMTVSQFPASSQAGQGPEPLDNASRQPNKPHRVENQARDDQN